MSTLKKFFKDVETTMAAASFAEAGEFDSARELLHEQKKLEKRNIKRDTKTTRPRMNVK